MDEQVCLNSRLSPSFIAGFGGRHDTIRHYIRDFGAIRVFAKQSGGPIMLMIADNATLSLFNTYLS